MLTASVLPPHPALSELIQNYTLCLSESPKVKMGFPLYAHHETSIGFFLGDTSIHIKNQDTGNETENASKAFLFGLSTHCKESMTSAGNYNTFTIEFTPNGFHKLFGIAAHEISNSILPAGEVIGNGVENLYEQLLNSTSGIDMVAFANKFLLNFLNRKKAAYTNEGITQIAYHLVTKGEMGTISQYAYNANMSIRNFERRFTEQVGTSPKLFCRLLRFNSALKYKISNPEINWTDLAYEFAYYDNMHLIKEFKQFTNTSPAILLKENPGFVDNGCYKIRPLLNG